MYRRKSNENTKLSFMALAVLMVAIAAVGCAGAEDTLLETAVEENTKIISRTAVDSILLKSTLAMGQGDALRLSAYQGWAQVIFKKNNQKNLVGVGLHSTGSWGTTKADVAYDAITYPKGCYGLFAVDNSADEIRFAIETGTDFNFVVKTPAAGNPYFSVMDIGVYRLDGGTSIRIYILAAYQGVYKYIYTIDLPDYTVPNYNVNWTYLCSVSAYTSAIAAGNGELFKFDSYVGKFSRWNGSAWEGQINSNKHYYYDDMGYTRQLNASDIELEEHYDPATPMRFICINDSNKDIVSIHYTNVFDAP